MSTKKTRGSAIAIGSIALMLLTAGCASGGAGGTDDGGQISGDGDIASMEPLELTLREAWPEQSAGGEAARAFMDYVTENTDGKITFDTYFSGTLVPSIEFLEAVGTGTADIGFMSVHNHPDQLDASMWIQAGASKVETQSYPFAYLESTAASFEFYTKTPEIVEQYTNNNVHLLAMTSSQPSDFFCSSPLTVESAKGMSTSAPGQYLQKNAEHLGMTPVTVSGAETYEALQRGVVDCAFQGAGAAFYPPQGVHEVAPYYAGVQGPQAIGGAGYIINREIWNNLPADAQEVFNEAAVQWALTYTRLNVEAYADFAQNIDVTFVDVGELNDELAVIQQQLYDDMRTNAPASIGDADAIVDLLDSARAKWATSVQDFVDMDVVEQRTGEEVKQAFIEAPDKIDWDAYFEALAEILK